MSINANRHARARGHPGKGWGARATAWIPAFNPGASEPMHVLFEMEAFPGEGVIVPDTCATTDKRY